MDPARPEDAAERRTAAPSGGPGERAPGRAGEEARFLAALEAALERGAAQGEPVSVAIAVLPAGAADALASRALDAARPELPPSGMSARVAENRLALLFPGLDPADVRRRAQRITARCPSLAFGLASSAPEDLPSGPRALLADAEAAAGRSRACVLVVEDEPDVAEILEMFLSSQAPLEVMVACTGAEAFARARARRPDLVLLDLELPDTDGASLLARLRTVHADLPAVAVSGKRPEDAAGAGFTAFFRKPVDLARLVREVQRMLRAPPGA